MAEALTLAEDQSVMPLLLGYQSARGTLTPAGMRAGQQALERFARQEGFALGDVFCEADAARPNSALTALTDAAVRRQASAIAVPTAEDLGRLGPIQERMRRQIEKETGIRVVIVQQGS